MKTVTVNVYLFDELNDNAKDTARDWFRSSFSSWWDTTYEDALNIGLKITGFDFERSNIYGQLTKLAIKVAANIIHGEYRHGETCETFKAAVAFQAANGEAAAAFNRGQISEETHEQRQEEYANTLEADLLAAYLDILRKEYEYISSNEFIDDAIKSNEYTFTDNGTYFLVKKGPFIGLSSWRTP